MTQTDRDAVRQYLGEVRRGLRGMPAENVDDTIEEMRTHLLEEIGERGDTVAVLSDFGDPAEVASAIVERRLRPEDGPAVAQASLGRRYSAWATDMVIGFGPLVIVPTIIGFIAATAALAGAPAPAGFQPVWLLIALHIGSAWIGDPVARVSLGLDVVPAVPVWQWILLAIMLAWALYYWIVLRRSRSASVGMWMTGLRGVRLADDRIVVRERDIAQWPPPLGAGRNRWWILLALVPVGCWCMLLAVFYLSAGVSTFLAPLGSQATYSAIEQTTRERALVADFEDALIERDTAAAQTLCGPGVGDSADRLVRQLATTSTASIAIVGESGTYFLTAPDASDRGEFTAVILVGKSVERADNTYTERYFIEAIDVPEVTP